MKLLVSQKYMMDQFAQELVTRVREAILNKPIERYTPSQGNFTSVVNASGRLANSIRYEVTDEEILIYAEDYIDNLIYGTPPGEPYPNMADIDNWIAHKGLDLYPGSVSNALHNNGSSIWQRFRGADSGLLSEAFNPRILENFFNQLSEQTLSGAVDQILEKLKIAAAA